MFRIAMVLLASALAGFSIWILLPETSRSGVHRLPTNAEAATAAAAARERAGRAAQLGAIRGDLWAEFAFTYAAPIWPGTEPGTDPLAVANEARAVVERALSYAPHDAGVWLLSASLASRFNWPNSDPPATLKMSYYTGPNETDLVPLRLLTATHLDVLSDGDLRQLVQRDVSMILTRWPELKPALLDAYRAADPAVKQFLESVVADTDANFLQSMRADTRQ
jgi:hypothetical protein